MAININDAQTRWQVDLFTYREKAKDIKFLLQTISEINPLVHNAMARKNQAIENNSERVIISPSGALLTKCEKLEELINLQFSFFDELNRSRAHL